MEAKKGLYKKLAYHFVMNNLTVPQSLEGLKVESCKAFAKRIHDVTALSRAIANGTAIAADARSRLMMARTAEFRSAIDSEKMVNAWEVTRHWDGHHLQAARAKLLRDFAGIVVDFKKMRPRQVAEQLAKVKKTWLGRVSGKVCHSVQDSQAVLLPFALELGNGTSSQFLCCTTKSTCPPHPEVQNTFFVCYRALRITARP